MTQTDIRQKMQAQPSFVEECILKLSTAQTPVEHTIAMSEGFGALTPLGKSTEQNRVGFSAADAPYLTWVASYLTSGFHLEPGAMTQKATNRMLKYSRQLMV